MNASASPMKMDAPMSDDSDTTIGDNISSNLKTDSALDKESLSYDLHEAMDNYLLPKESSIVRSFFGINCMSQSLENIAESFGLSRERTRQICNRALEKLRHSPCASKLMVYLAA